MARRDQAAHALDHCIRRRRSARPAALRDDAEGAGMVAPVLHLDQRARMAGEGDHWRRPGRAPTGGGRFGGVGDHPIHLGHRMEARRVDRRRAARHHQLGPWPCLAHTADRGARLLDRRAGHRAAVDHHGVAPRQHRADRLAFGEVQAAAKRDDLWSGCMHGGRSRGEGGPSHARL
jgi:hypothetical protein